MLFLRSKIILWKFDKVDLTNEVFVWKQVEMKFPHLENFIAAAREIPAAKDSMPRYEPALCLMGA
ncbi:hypothetical protein Osc2_12750 [Ruminococcus sp. 25CYCFAH16]